MSLKISVIIVNYNSGARLERCIACLGEQDFKNFETIIIDNQSTDGSIEFARALPYCTVIDAGSNIGFAAANNLAAKEAKGEWLAFLNPDAYAAPDWLAALEAATKRHPTINSFGSTQISDHDREIIDGAGDAYHAFGIPYRGHFGWSLETLPDEGTCFAPCGAAAMVRRSIFLSLGGFFEKFFCYCEDVDLGFRLHLAGEHTVQVKSAIVYHEGSGTTGRNSTFTVYHGHRNRIWTYYLNMPLALLILTWPFHVATNLYLLVRIGLAGRLGTYWRAMIDAHLGLPSLMAERRRRQRSRTASTVQIAKALTWSPLKPMRRQADLRPIEQTGLDAAPNNNNN